MSYHILIVDDEAKIASTLTKGFEQAGMITSVISNGLTAKASNLEGVDLVILDWMLPEISGLDILHYWRKNKLTTPVIMFTAKNQVKDKVLALETGADDYIAKFFEWDELLARIRALLRRSTPQLREVNQIIIQGEVLPIILNRQMGYFTYNQQIIDLTDTEYKILKYFLDNPNRIINQTSLIRALWERETNPFSNVIERHIKSIRKKLPYDPITTHRGLGYRLKA